MLALGQATGGIVRLSRLQRLETLEGFAEWLRAPQEWIAGFDFPFGLPRPLVEHLGWPTEWRDCMQHYAGLTRAQIAALRRPSGSRAL